MNTAVILSTLEAFNLYLSHSTQFNAILFWII